MKMVFRHLISMGCKISKPAGMRQIYTNNGGPQVPASDFLPLVYRNMSTLTNILANLEESSETNFGGIVKYPNFSLQRLNHRTVWPNKRDGPLDLLRAISSCKNFKQLYSTKYLRFRFNSRHRRQNFSTAYLKFQYVTRENNISNPIRTLHFTTLQHWEKAYH